MSSYILPAIVAKSKTIPCYFFIFYAIVNADFKDIAALGFLKVGHRWRIGGPSVELTQSTTNEVGLDNRPHSFYCRI